MDIINNKTTIDMKSLKLTLISVLCIIALMLSFAGCSPETIPTPEPEPEVVFQFDQKSYTFTCNADLKYLKLESTNPWRLDASMTNAPVWVNLIDPTEGEGDAVISVGLLANPYTSERKAELWFVNDQSKSISVEIIQEMNPNGVASYKYLGAGYNASGEYAYDGDVKSKVLDIDMLVAKGYVADILSLNRTDERYVYGKTFEEYQESLTQQASISGSYGAFSASISNSFSKETLSSAENEFATFRHITKKQSYKLMTHLKAEELKPCVIPSAQEEIDNMEPLKLFEKYGTHVISGFVLGGSLDYAMSADVSTCSSAVDWSIAASAGFQYMSAGAETSAGYGEFNKMRNESANFESTLKARGGESQYASNNPNASESTYASWLASLEDPTKWVMVDYDGSQLIPIWDFASSPERKSVLETAALDYLTAPKIDKVTTHRKLGVDVIKVGCTDDDAGGTAEMEYWFYWKHDDLPEVEFAYFYKEVNDNMADNPNSWASIDPRSKTVGDLSIYKPHTLKIRMHVFEDDTTGDDKGDGSYTLVYDNKKQVWHHNNESGAEIKNGETFNIKTGSAGGRAQVRFRWEK